MKRAQNCQTRVEYNILNRGVFYAAYSGVKEEGTGVSVTRY